MCYFFFKFALFLRADLLVHMLLVSMCLLYILINNKTKQDELCVFPSSTEPSALARTL